MKPTSAKRRALASTYLVETTAPNGATFTIKRTAEGELERTCNKTAEETHGGLRERILVLLSRAPLAAAVDVRARAEIHWFDLSTGVAFAAPCLVVRAGLLCGAQAIDSGGRLTLYGGHLRRSAGRHRGLIPERSRISPAAARIAGCAPLALPLMRGAGAALRQRSRPLLAAAAGALPRLLAAHLRRAIRWSRRAPRCCARPRSSPRDGAGKIALSVALLLVLLPAALIDLEYRIIPNKLTAAGALLALGSAPRWTRPASRTADSRRGRRRLPLDRGAGLSARDGHG